MHKGVGADDSDEYEDMLPLSSLHDAIQVSAGVLNLAPVVATAGWFVEIAHTSLLYGEWVHYNGQLV